MMCDECGGGLLVRSIGMAAPRPAWECLGCGRINADLPPGGASTIGDVLAGRAPAGAGDG